MTIDATNDDVTWDTDLFRVTGQTVTGSASVLDLLELQSPSTALPASVATSLGGPVSGPTQYLGNTVIREGLVGESLFFINDHPGPNARMDMFLGNSTTLFQLLTSEDLPWSIQNGGFGADNIE
ncbi:MAG: hypothetical protein Q8P67_19790, partial [archaeon]|nr:hypothetical protein [archaeon]